MFWPRLISTLVFFRAGVIFVQQIEGLLQTVIVRDLYLVGLVVLDIPRAKFFNLLLGRWAALQRAVIQIDHCGTSDYLS